MTLSSAQSSTRLVLEGVPRVHFYEGGARCPEDIIFPSCLRACLEYLGEKEFGCKHCLVQNPNCKIFCSYSYLLGTSGGAALLSWRPSWHMDNQVLHHMSSDPFEPYRRAFASVGYTCQMVYKDPGRDNESFFRQSIIKSIQNGLPVIAFGVVGPPEPVILTGYDDDGNILVGWSFFQADPGFNAGVEFEPAGYFRKTAWFQDTEALILLGEKCERPGFDETYRSALEWLVQVTTTPKVETSGHERYNGLAAYTAWAEQLLRDEDFPGDNVAVLRECHMVHDMAVGYVAEARWYGSQFLIEAADPNHLHFSLAEYLYKAAGCYAAEHNLMWKLWDLAGGNGNPGAFLKFAEPEIRRKMAPIILQAREKDSEAIQYIQRALEIHTA